jgi:catalase
MRYDGNFGSAPNYEPNSFGGPKEDKQYADRPIKLSGEPAARYSHRENNDDYTQAGDLFRLMSEDQKNLLCSNIAGSLGQTPIRIQELQLSHFEKADPDYAKRVQKFLVENEHPDLAHTPNEAEYATRMPEK